MVTPLFLFSLPRSGSTLLQRVLAQHPAISTCAEPWLLLPLFYTLHPTGAYTDYGHRLSVGAIEDLCAELPNGRHTYLDEVRRFAVRIYDQLAGSRAQYFLDKTPRYHLVCREILETFKDAKFIFLWRNPLAVVASSVSTWSRGTWAVHGYKVDLYDGLAELVDVYQANRDRTCAVRFEQFLNNPRNTSRRISQYLGLDLDAGQLTAGITSKNFGRLGDPTGVERYGALSSEPLDKWREAISNPIRHAWCRQYLRWIGRDRLKIMGYDLHELLSELSAIPYTTKNVVNDLTSLGRSILASWAEPDIVREKLRQMPALRKVHPHR